MAFGLGSPAYAAESADTDDLQRTNQLSESEKAFIMGELSNFDVEDYASNIDELSDVNRQIVNDTLKKVDLGNGEIFADISENGEMLVIAQTEKENTTVNITDNLVEVVEQVDQDTYKINGETNDFEVTISGLKTNSEGPSAMVSPDGSSGDVQALAADGWVEISYRSGPWTYLYADRIDVNAERVLSSYSASVIGGIVGAAVAAGSGFGWFAGIAYSAGAGIAYTFAASDEYPTNVGIVYLTADRRNRSRAYAVYQGDNIYLGTDYTYYYRCIGCGGV